MEEQPHIDLTLIFISAVCSEVVQQWEGGRQEGVMTELENTTRGEPEQQPEQEEKLKEKRKKLISCSC